MADFVQTLTDQIQTIFKRIRALELSVFSYGQQPNTPPAVLAVTSLTGTTTYYVEPVTGLPRALVTWTWTAPSSDDDPVATYMVSITRSIDTTTGAFADVGNVTSLITSDLPVNTSVTVRIYAVSRTGVIGPTASYALIISTSSTPPPQSSTPSIISAVKGVRVYNDGKDYAGNTMPSDFAYYELHMAVNSSDTFIPSTATLYTTFGTNDSVFIPGNDSYDPIYVRLVTVNTSGVKGPVSTGVHATPSRVVASDVNIVMPGSVAFSDTGNLLPDGSFESSLVRTARSALFDAGYTYDSTAGLASHGTYCLKLVSTTATAKTAYLVKDGVFDNDPLSEIMVSPISNVYIAAKVRNVSSNGTITLRVRVRYNDGTFTTIDKTVASTDITTGDWQTVATVIDVPQNAVSIRLSIVANSVTTGTWYFDAIHVRNIISTLLIEDAAITRAKIGAMAVGSAQIEEIDAALIKSGYIDANRIKVNSITSSMITAGAVGSEHLAPTVGNTLDISNNAALSDMASKNTVNSINNTVSALNTSVTKLNNSVIVDTNGVTLQQTGSPFSVNLNNASLDFKEGGVRVAYINGQTMYIKSATVTSQFTIGVHVLERYDANNTFVKWVG